MRLALAIGVLGSIASAALAFAPLERLESAPSYELVMEYRGERFILDHGLTIDDCVGALPRNDPFKHVGFACELEF